MKNFDYIVGNPPYHYPSGVNPAEKLYVDISIKCLEILKPDGIISFITPAAIMQKGLLNKVFNKIKNNIISVNFDSDKFFNIGQTVITWNYSPNYTGMISLIEDGKKRVVEGIDDVYRKKDADFYKIMKKVDITYNNKDKLRVSICGSGTVQKKISDTKTDEYTEEVWCNSKKHRIKYCKMSDKVNVLNEKRLIIPYVGGWSEGAFISDLEVNKNTTLSHKGIKQNELENMKNYLNSKLISYLVVNFSIVVKPSAYYTFVSKLPELDFSKPWTDEELYKEFNITEEEQKIIEDWYEEWKN